MLGSPIKYKHVFSYNITSIVEVSKTKKLVLFIIIPLFCISWMTSFLEFDKDIYLK